MRVAIANLSKPVAATNDFEPYWAAWRRPPKPEARVSLFEQEVDWGFHLEAIGVYLMDRGVADEVEFWDFSDRRYVWRKPNGVLKLHFLGEADLRAYLERYGYPDLFVNHGPHARGVLRRLEGRCFRVHVPVKGAPGDLKSDLAECYLVDSEEHLDERSMLYVPVVNTRRFRPAPCEERRDFVYLAACYPEKRHDILVNAVRGSTLTGHLHPVNGSLLDLSETRITTSDWNEVDVVDLLRSSRMAVYPGAGSSNPAAMWECVATGLPIVVHREILGGKHLVVEGVTGELASGDEFREVMEHVLANLDSYSPREYFEQHWDTVETIEQYLAFFARMGWTASPCS